MSLFFQSRIPDETVVSFRRAVAKAAALPPTADPSKVLELSSEALARSPAEEILDWKHIGLVSLLLLLLIAGGLFEYHLGSSTVSERLFTWAERLFTLVVGIVVGEAAARK